MTNLSRTPSNYYPDFFRLDLQVGLPSAHPVAAALDGLSQRLSDDCFEETWGLEPSRMNLSLRRGFLSDLGFHIEALTDSEVITLFDCRNEILKHRGTLLAIKQLAEIYLGNCEIQRGRPEKAMRLTSKGATRLLLTDTQEASGLVFIRCQKVATEARVSSFLKSTSVLIPFGVSVLVAPPLKKACPRIAGFSLSGVALTTFRI